METIILVGGRGTRLGASVTRPKCLIEVGDRPIVRHVMDVYARHGYRDFVLAAGYKVHQVVRYFRMWNGYNVEVVDTGPLTATGGRIHRFEPESTFMATYGDGIGNVDITALVAFHKRHGKLATVTAVRPPARFGHLEILQSTRRPEGIVTEFNEKPQTGEGWISGGFFVFEPGVLDYIDGDDIALEREPLSNLAKDGELMAYLHEGFWQPMDTMRDRELLEDLWNSKEVPWLI